MLRSNLPGEFSTYYEPFAGSACLFFAITPADAVLSDTNAYLVQAYEAVRDDAEGVHRWLMSLDLGREAYLEERARDPRDMSATRRAARLIYLMQGCYGGIYRVNRQNAFNVPYGGVRTGALPALAVLQECSSALRGIRLVCGDFEETLRQAGEGDFVYLDPPYARSCARPGLQYGYDAFGTADLVRLRRTLNELHSRGVAFLLSYADCEEVRELINPGWRVSRCEVRRCIARRGEHRVRSTELLICNY